MNTCPRCGKDNPAEVHTCTPKALVLAQRLGELANLEANELAERMDDAAVELRRLHEAHDWQYTMAGERLRRIEKDEALLKQALDAMNTVLSGGDFDHPYAELKQAAAAIKERLGCPVQ